MGIGAVNIAIGATTSDFEAALAAASSAVGNFRDNFKSAFEGLKGSADSPKYAFQAVNRELQKTANEMRNILVTGGQVPDQLRKKYEALRATVTTVNGALNQTKTTQTGLAGSITAMATGYFSVAAAIGAVKKGLSITTDMQRMNTAIKAVSTSAGDFNNAQTLLLGTADRLGVSYEALAQSFKGIKAATNGTALEGKAMEKIFLSVVRASATLQLSADDTKGALLALQQMISKGTVSAEELRGQLGERIPGAFRLFAEAAGVSEQKLGDMLKQGEIAAVDILPKFADKLNAAFGAQAAGNVNTLGGSMQRLKDQTALLVAEFSDTSGVTGFFTGIQNGIADTLAGMRQAVRDKDWLTFFGALSPSAGGQALREGLARSAQNQSKVAEFQGQDPATRRKTLDDLKSKIEEGRAQIAGGVGNEEIKALLREREDLLLALQKANLKLTLEERRAADEKPAKTGEDKTAYEKAKARLQELKVLMKDYQYRGEEPPKAIADEFKRLSDRLEQTDGAFKKVRESAFKPFFKDASSPVSVYSQLLAETEKEIDSYVLAGKEIPKVLADQREGYKLLIEEMKKMPEAYSLPTFIDKKGNVTDRMRSKGLFETALPRQAEMLDKFGFWGGKQQNGFDPVAQKQKYEVALQEILGEFKGKGADQAQKRFEDLVGGGMNIEDAKNKVLNPLKELTNGTREILKQGAADALAGMGEFIGALFSGSASAEQLPQMLLGTIGGVAQQFGRLAIGIGVGMEAVKKSFQSLTGIGAIAAGVGLIALGTAFKQGAAKIGGQMGATPFAAGGLVYGPTLGLVGEGTGTNLRNPEVVAPLDKLQSMIGGGGSRVIIPNTYLRGQDIVIAYEEAKKTNNDWGVR